MADDDHSDSDSSNGKQGRRGEGEFPMPLTEASKTGFNERAWNDPPPLLMSATAGSSKHADTPRPKLTARLAYPVNDPAIVPHIPPLDASGPPPTCGFIKLATSADTTPEKSTDSSPRSIGSLSELSTETLSDKNLLLVSTPELESSPEQSVEASATQSLVTSPEQSLAASPGQSLEASPEHSPEKPPSASS